MSTMPRLSPHHAACSSAQQEIEGTVDGELAVVISSIASACKQVRGNAHPLS